MSATDNNDLQVGRFKIRWRSYGGRKDGNFPIVCVSGAYQTMGAWKSFISHFRPFTQIVTFDMPGLGGARIIDGGTDISLREKSEILSAVIDHAAQGRVNIFAASWGGAVSSMYASLYPERVEKLVLASFGLRANDEMKNVIRMVKRHIADGTYRSISGIVQSSFGRRLPSGMKRNLDIQFQQADTDGMRQLYEHLSWCETADLMSDIEFSRIRAATHILNGTDDEIIDFDTLASLEAIIPDCTRSVVSEYGHFLHFENPALLRRYQGILGCE